MKKFLRNHHFKAVFTLNKGCKDHGQISLSLSSAYEMCKRHRSKSDLTFLLWHYIFVKMLASTFLTAIKIHQQNVQVNGWQP